MKATIYNASAGSGKTYTLAYKYVRDVIEQPLLYRNILAVTFTNKATEEMKRRILSEIHLLASGDSSKYLEQLCSDLSLSQEAIRARALKVRGAILHDYSRFTILTIDRFFQRIIRAFIQELGIDINYNIELDPTTLLTQSADRIIEEINANEELKLWIGEFIEERIEDGRSWDMRQGILSLGGEIFKESNRESLEGSCTKAELKRIIDKFIQRGQIERAKFKEVGQHALEIIESHSLQVESFSGKSRSFATYFRSAATDQIKEPTKSVRQRAASTDGWGKGVEQATIELQPLLAELVQIYDNGIKIWNTAALLRENYRSFALLKDLYDMVQRLSNEQNMMLLSETKLILSKFIADNHAPFIYEKVGSKFERFMIDEFQDTSIKEWENFLPLLDNAISQSQANSVLIVGDIKQSIYRWRGGDWRILHSLAKEQLGAENTEVINLKANYRSLPSIVRFNNSLIETLVSSDNDALNEKLEAAAEIQAISGATRNELRNMIRDAYSDHQQIPHKSGECEGYIEVTIHENEPQIVDRIKEVMDLGFKPCEILILVRSNSEGVKVAGKLLEFKRENQDPRYYFDVMTQEALMVGLSPISQFIIASLRLAIEPTDSIQLAIFNSFLGRGEFNLPLDDALLASLRSLGLRSTEEAFENIVMLFGLNNNPNNIAYLQAIHESICNFCISKSGDIALFLKWWEEHGAQRSISVEQSDKSIEITTIHKAKGLEKAVVMIPYCTWGLDPKSGGAGVSDPKKPQKSNAVWAQAQAGLESLGTFPVKYKKAMGESLFSEQYYREFVYSHIDNINMLYVALTRASQSLHLFIKEGKLGIGKAITEALPKDDGKVTLLEIEGEQITTTNEQGEQIRSLRFGKRSAPLKSKGEEAQADLYIMDSYPTAQADLRLRLPSQRYFEQDQSSDLSPQSEGILMHKIFAEAASAEQITEKIQSMELNGQISPSQSQSLKIKIDQALLQEPIKSWFSQGWDAVYNERDIILPKCSNFKRPDRVMTLGQRAIVIDYKFGEHEISEHKKQVAGYMSLLEQMGYRETEGYIWYIKNGRIVAV